MEYRLNFVVGDADVDNMSFNVETPFMPLSAFGVLTANLSSNCHTDLLERDLSLVLKYAPAVDIMFQGFPGVDLSLFFVNPGGYRLAVDPALTPQSDYTFILLYLTKI